jgi:uncharacterized protein (TIGR00251 family)
LSDARLPWIEAVNAVLVEVRLTPRGGRDAIEGQAVVKARVRAAPSDGEANAALCRLVADAAGVAVRDVTIAAGAKSRVKRVRIEGRAAVIIAALRALLTDDR